MRNNQLKGACEKVRDSCKVFASELAEVDELAAIAFADTINVQEVKTFCFSGEGLSTNRFSEIPFTCAADEAGFIFLAHALDFGSGFRPLLHQHRNGQGAWLTIRAGLVNMGQANPSCESSWLRSISLIDVQSYFDLSAPDLMPLAQFLHQDIQEIGDKLLAEGARTPGEFLMRHATGGASHLVSLFVKSFPLCFCDEYVIRDEKVCFYKKAQLVVSEIYMRFASEVPEFNFPDIDNLTAFVDNVVVAMMRMNNVITTDEKLAADISNNVPILKGSEEEVALRSASLTAIELIVSALVKKHSTNGGPPVFESDIDRLRYAWSTASPQINAQMVCNWLWGHLGKLGDNRKYPRHLCPSTSYY